VDFGELDNAVLNREKDAGNDSSTAAGLILLDGQTADQMMIQCLLY